MTDKTALVTGAASGIGLATATRLAKRNVTTILVDRSAAVTEAAAKLAEAGYPAIGRQLDLGDADAIRVACEELVAKHGGIDILVNNAGIHPKKAGGKFLIEETPLSDWSLVLDVNLTAPFLLAAALLRSMKAKRWGRVVSVSSAGAKNRPFAPSAHYVASKAGLEGLSRCIAEEGAKFGITSNCVSPGPIKTGLTASSSPEAIAELTKAVPIGRYGEPDEIAAMIDFLASDQAAFITGAVMEVNGGVGM